MRVVDLADSYRLTTQEAIDLCLAAGIAAENGADVLSDEQVQRWQQLAEQQRQWRAANAAAEAHARAEREAERAQRRSQMGDLLVDQGAPEGGPQGFGPIPPAPWETGGEDGGGAAGNGSSGPAAIPTAWNPDNAVEPQVAPLAPAALALALLSFLFPFVTAFLAIALAQLAKHRIERSNGRLTGERMANIAQYISYAGIAVWLALLCYSFYNDYQRTQKATKIADLQVNTEVLQWNQLAKGVCVRVPHADIDVAEWQGVRCDAPHEGEVISVHQIARPEGDPYPGRQSFIPLGKTLCAQDFQDYVGSAYATSSLEMATVFPKAGNWASEDDRTVACVVYQKDYDLTTGSVQGTKQ